MAAIRGGVPVNVSLELPRSAAYAIEDREATDAGLRRTARSNDAGRDDHDEQGCAEQVARLGGDVGGDRAPSVAGTQTLQFDEDAFLRACRGSVGGAEAPAGHAPATQDMLGAIDFGGDLRN